MRALRASDQPSRRARAPSMSSHSFPVRRAVVLAPGRSGSTLLQSVFLANCDALTFFEPCRHSPDGDVRKDKCVAQVLRYLSCDLPQANGDWDPPAIRGWLRHPYNDANTSCVQPPLRSVAKTRLACQRVQLLLVKEIRLVGELARLAAALTFTQPNTGSTAIIHLVRDPRPMLASQKRLRWWGFGEMTSRRRRLEMERVAKRTCEGMVADAAVGDALQRAGKIRYFLVRFEELTADLESTTLRLYAQLGLPLPHTTVEWMNRTLGGHCAHGSAEDASANASIADKQFEYSTCRQKRARRSREARSSARWKHLLTMHEKRAINTHCAGAFARFGYSQS